MTMRRSWLVVAAVLAASVTGGAAAAADGPYGLPALARDDFNRLAALEGLPLFWVADEDEDGEVSPDELAVLGVSDSGGAPYVKDGALTEQFETAYRTLVEARRREAVRRELNQGRPTIVHSDLTDISAAEKKFVGHVLDAASKIDALHLKQRGAAQFDDRLTALDAESRALFDRNMGPWCSAPKTESDPFCSALPDFPARTWDGYPADEGQDLAMCDRLSKRPDAASLLDPFTVVRREGGSLVAIPYHEAYAEEMGAIAADLRAAAKALEGADEAALQTYLRAAADAFETGDWFVADEAWAAMNATNSAWYLRIGPDEVYWDVCSEKAGFHVSFARIDRRSLEWQAKLNPLRTKMEESLAALIGKSYAPREVSFQMPDFIGIVINAGNSRAPMGATIGQSLPNWGPVATEGRGRTVVMTNLYTDPDSKRIGREKAADILSAESMKYYTDDELPGLLDIILHEACHNLGPHSDYRIAGKDPGEVFGGRLATVLEELKAQTGSLYYVELLRKEGIIDATMAKRLYTHALTWAFSHISRGMFTPSGGPKPYSQLAAVQVGYFVKAGALAWKTTTDAATGESIGRFEIDHERFPKAVDDLMKEVGRIKAEGDVAGAKALIDPFITGADKGLVHMPEITQRLLRYPKGSMVYSVTL